MTKTIEIPDELYEQIKDQLCDGGATEVNGWQDFVGSKDAGAGFVGVFATQEAAKQYCAEASHPDAHIACWQTAMSDKAPLAELRIRAAVESWGGGDVGDGGPGSADRDTYGKCDITIFRDVRYLLSALATARAERDKAHFARIEAQNPGIDIERVRREHYERTDQSWTKPDHPDA